MSAKNAKMQEQSSAPLLVDRRKQTSPHNVGVPRSKRQKAEGDGEISHVRFGSEESRTEDAMEKEAATISANDEQQATAQQEDSDEDAPEAVGASEARAELRANASGRNRAIEEKRRAAKGKRQAMDLAFKEQAKLLKSQEKQESREKRKRRELTASTELHSQSKSQNIGQDIPNLLPEEVLEDASFHEPTPEPANKPTQKSVVWRNTQIRPDAESVKDVQVGPVSVSVLKKQSGLLPPKANIKSMSTKRKWLLGRRGKEGQIIQRKKAARSFLRS
ncbi:MAG: hypothetical protein M1831_003902 [Alyxoria varia]|nr:MAG: hypothetical protein M1831_003902 [Alyxoria varia]